MIAKRNLPVHLLILCVAAAASLVFAEVILRSIFPRHEQKYSVAPTSNQYEFYQFDEKLGWSNAPLMRGVQQRDEFRYPIRINEHGMRNRPVNVDPDKDIYRIAFLGDSFVWGIGVPDEERFSDIVGNLPNIESCNFGVSGYGPVQYYLLIDQVKKFKPNLIILTFCLSNDFDDNVQQKKYDYYKPHFVLNGKNELELKGYPIINVNAFGRKRSDSNPFLKHSRFFMLFNGLLDRLRGTEAASVFADFSDEDIYDFPNSSGNKRTQIEQVVLINKLILAKIKQELDAAHIPLVVVAAPTKFEYLKIDRRSHERINTNALDLLENTLRELGIDYIDAVHHLNIHDFWKIDGHYNPQGHRKVAGLIRRYLQEKNIPRTSLPVEKAG